MNANEFRREMRRRDSVNGLGGCACALSLFLIFPVILVASGSFFAALILSLLPVVGLALWANRHDG